MTTEEIIRRLKNILRDPRWPDLCASAEDVRKDGAAMTTAIQAVRALEEAKKALKGQCAACKHLKVPSACMAPCADCVRGAVSGWEFRWPLGEDTTT